MAQQNSQSINIIGALLIIGALVVGLGYGWWSIKQAPSANEIKVAPTTVVKSPARPKDTLKSLAELKRYGDWPIGVVTLSPDRGNPFAAKR